MPDRPPPTVHMHCPHCGLTVRLRAAFLTLDVCPRCLARKRVARPMELASEADAPEAGGGPARAAAA